MLQLALKFWPYIVVAALVIGMGVLINNWRLDARELESVKIQLEEERKKPQIIKNNCQKAKETTAISKDEYDKEIAARDARIAELRKRPSRCVPIYINRPAQDSAGPANEHVDGDGMSSDLLFYFASKCEGYRAGQGALQKHLGRVQCYPKQITGDIYD